MKKSQTKRQTPESAGYERADDDLLTSSDVAAWLGVSIQFVEIARARNSGPPYTRLSSRCIRYRRSDVAAWLRDRTHRSTSEYTGGE